VTILCRDTKNILYIKEFLGHRKLETKLGHLRLGVATFRETSDEFTVRVASKPQEIQTLLAMDFECVCREDELFSFRKRK
jgi:hypothetical protein